MTHRVALQPAYLLHRRPYRDTSLLLEVFSLDYGRVGLVAHGARKQAARIGGILQPFRPLLLSWSGRGELPTLTAGEAGEEGPALAGRRLYSGFYLNELVQRLIARQDPHPALFRHYVAALSSLAGDSKEQPTLRLFEKVLLRELGYGLVLAHEADSPTPIDPDARYHYHPQRGPVCLGAGDQVESVFTVHGATLSALDRGELQDPRALAEARSLLRALLAIHLGPRPLQSRKLYADFLQLRGPRPGPHDPVLP